MGSIGLVADIGRQSVRFALSGGDGTGDEPSEVKRYATTEYPTFTNALVDYLAGVGLKDDPVPTALAVSGLIRGDVVNVTGSRWFVSLSGVEAVTRVRPIALNECAANAVALSRLAATDFVALPGPPVPRIQPGGTFLVVGPGTGFGVAALVGQGDRLFPLQTEGGHIGFAAQTDAELQVVAHLARQRIVPSVEAVLSAGGLSRIYAALAGPGAPAKRPEEITRDLAHDRLAGRSIDVYVEALGAVIGDYVLAYGAWDGVFLTGAFARALAPRLAAPALRRRLEDKDAFRRQLSQLPIAVVKRSALELIGAAAALAQA